jgi:hypothetical protein
MPWEDTARRDHARPASRYASDLTNREWTLIAPFLPPPRQQGRPRSADLREVMNAILNMASAGCQWRMLPKDLPPPSRMQRYFYGLARPRIVADDQQPSGGCRARTGGSRGEPHGWRHRQSKRENVSVHGGGGVFGVGGVAIGVCG